MKLLALVALAGCPSNQPAMCESDSQCGANVCARNGECLPASEVRSVRVTWTIRGAPANATTCASMPSLYIQFDGSTVQDSFGYAPVPCQEGVFSIDKLPSRFAQVELGVEGGPLTIGDIQPDGTASLDLTP